MDKEEIPITLEEEETNLQNDLLYVDNRGFTLRCFPSDDPLSREDYIDVDKKSLEILWKKMAELNYTVLLGAIRYILKLFEYQKILNISNMIILYLREVFFLHSESQNKRKFCDAQLHVFTCFEKML